MARGTIGRRELMRWSAGASGTLWVGGTAHAAQGDLLDLLGLRVRKALMADPATAKPLNILRTIAAIIELERTARQKGLPVSPLAFNEGAALPTSETSLYQAAMPRLVSLIDRSESLDPEICDQAGEILADLNASQRVAPEGLGDAIKLSAARDFAELKPEYATLFSAMQVRSEFADTLRWHVDAARRNKPRYEAVSRVVGTPWYFIAAIHGLEASYNFRAHLHNGDFPLTARTRQVPAGRPLVWLPPSDWESSAKDALTLLGFAGQSDWSLERTLYRLEAYNGFGYRKRGVATPYIWSFSNHYDRGKFVSDGRWNPEARSQQCGGGVVIRALADAGEISLA
jgi:lysozyme family protein